MSWEVQYLHADGWYFFAAPPMTRDQAIEYVNRCREHQPGVKFRIRYGLHWSKKQ